ncbi:MAG TPA: ferrous iron transport protein B [Deltaproteobacteria bacterium]|nr:ferrous iron transport protein B [Deltaproteobacteria bacterium]HQB38207.1 ferrous iron transport protein B [Deltaproteobacteria bacterium]
MSADNYADSQLGQGVPKLALVGNPNVGKSLLFNVLTGTYVTVSNYPGTSVEVSRGHAMIGGRQWQVIDTPGMYSIHTITEEERVAREILLNETPDVVLHVLDARNLERMLAMTLQLIEAGLPVILVVNIMDEAERLGISIDLPLLQQRLGIPVVGAATARKVGVDDIRQAVAEYNLVPMPDRFRYSPGLEEDVASLMGVMTVGCNLSAKSMALLLLQQDEEVMALFAKHDGPAHVQLTEKLREIAFRRRESFHLDLFQERREIVRSLLDGVFHAPEKRVVTVSERISNLAVRPLTGVPLLLIVLYFGLYRFVGDFGAGTLVDLLEKQLFEGLFSPWVSGVVRGVIPWEAMQDLFVGEYGIITLGLRYAVGIILPIVATFFLFFSFLEDSGYFPRLALVVDRVFKRIGLTGRAVIPMVLGFGCDTMATMVTRTLETTRERIIATLLLALAIPCSAQLGVIIGLLSKVEGALAVWGGCMLALFLLVGLLAARVMPGEPPMFYMELPPMRMPRLGNVLTKTYSRMQWYFLEILPLFILASVLLWLGKLSGFFERMIDVMTPLMALIGLPREAAVAFIFGFFRRDYGAAGLYDLQSQGLMGARQLTVAAVTLTLFVPCIAQFLVMKKERGWKVACQIALLVSLIALSSGFLLNRLLLSTGWL